MRYPLGIALSVIVLLMLAMPALAQSGDHSTPVPLILTDDQEKYPLGLHLDILEDPIGELTIDEVSSSEFDSQFLPSQVEVPVYGFTDTVFWVRLRLRNETLRTDYWLLENGFANTQFVDLYTPLPDGEGYAVKQTGVLRPASTRDISYPRIIFELTIPPESEQTVYLRFQSGASMTIPLALWTRKAFLNYSAIEQLLAGIFFGVLIGLLVYNLFLLFSLREVNYLFFVVLLASLIIEEASYSGYLAAYIIPNLGSLNKFAEPWSFSLLIASMVLFSDSFLELRTRIPNLHRINFLIVAVWGFLILLTPFTSYKNIASVAAPMALISLSAVLVAGIISWRRGFHSARFFMIAWLGLIASVFLVILVRLGIISSTYFRENIYHLGYLWMAVCWSIALADRINLLKAETEAANRALRTSQHQLSQILDGMPLGVVLYGNDQKPKFINRRTVDLLSNPDSGIGPDLSADRTIAQAIEYYAMQEAGSRQDYPLDKFPVIKALHGEHANADDIEMDRGDSRVPLEIWASPVINDAGNVESAVVAFQDITQRKQAEAELDEYRKHLERLVEDRTIELSTVNEKFKLHLEWLAAILLVNQTMARSSEYTHIYEKIIEIINRLFSFQDSFIAELDADSKQLKILAHSCHNENHPDLVGSFTTLNEYIVSDPENGKAMPASISQEQLTDISGPMSAHIEISQVQRISLIPLQLREQVLGVLGLEIHAGDRIISSDEYNLLEVFSTDIAQVIEDSRLIRQAKELITVEERNRLARDLHDSVTQVLFSVNLLADVLPQIWRRDPELGLQRLEKLRRLTRGALAEMRTMLLELRPSAVINTPLSELLGQLAEAVASRSGLQFQLSIDQIPPLPENVQTSFYRIAQEALNNVVKHAQANEVALSLSATPLPPDPAGRASHEVKLVIRDDGVGYSAKDSQSTHLGIGIMHERAAAIQGMLYLESQPGYGAQATLIWRGETGSKS